MKTLEALILELTGKISGFDIVALPAVFGLSSAASVKKLKESLDIPVWLIPTMPPPFRVFARSNNSAVLLKSWEEFICWVIR